MALASRLATAAYNIFLRVVPMETIVLLPKYRNRNPWVNKDIKEDIKKREKLLSISIKDTTESNKKLYKVFKNEVLSKQRKAEREYYQTQFELNADDLNKSWKILRRIIGKDENTRQWCSRKYLGTGAVRNVSSVLFLEREH